MIIIGKFEITLIRQGNRKMPHIFSEKRFWCRFIKKIWKDVHILWQRHFGTSEIFSDVPKGAYSHEYMGSFWRFSKTSLPEKKQFYCNLTMEDITDPDQNMLKGSGKISE